MIKTERTIANQCSSCHIWITFHEVVTWPTVEWRHTSVLVHWHMSPCRALIFNTFLSRSQFARHWVDASSSMPSKFDVTMT